MFITFQNGSRYTAPFHCQMEVCGYSFLLSYWLTESTTISIKKCQAKALISTILFVQLRLPFLPHYFSITLLLWPFHQKYLSDAWITTLGMRKSVALKRFQLQLYRNNWKLMTVLKGQVITNFSFQCMTASSLLPFSYLCKIIFLLNFRNLAF